MIAMVKNAIRFKFSQDVETCSIKRHRSFRLMNRVEAEAMLKRQSGTSYLTRWTTDRKQYRLSVHIRECDNVSHLPINVTHSGGNIEFEIAGTSSKFQDFFEMLAFYQEIPVNHYISTIGAPAMLTFIGENLLREAGKWTT